MPLTATPWVPGRACATTSRARKGCTPAGRTVLTLATLSDVASIHVRPRVTPEAAASSAPNIPMSAALDRGAQDRELVARRVDERLVLQARPHQRGDLLVHRDAVAVLADRRARVA